ncbi:MAG: ankyrin repeat domain-containing protein [Candidatus Sericytochromatia bacterium]
MRKALLTLAVMTALMPPALAAPANGPGWQENQTISELRTQLGQDASQKTRDSLLVQYVSRGDFNAVSFLLAQGAGINNANAYGNTPLIEAVVDQEFEMVKFLVSKGADLRQKTKRGNSLLFLTLDLPNPDIARYLVSQGLSVQDKSSEGNGPLFYTAAVGNTAMLDFLVQQGARINDQDAEGNTPLGWAFSEGAPQNIAYLLSKGADPKALNHQGETPIFQAIATNRLEIFETPIYGLGKYFDLNHPNKDGNTVLHLAILYGYYPLAKQLLSLDADPLLKNKQGQSSAYLLLANLGPVKAEPLATLETGLKQNGSSTLRASFAEAEALAQRLAALKANMRTLQTAVETYAVDHDGIFAPDLRTLYSEASKLKYWPELTNPLTGKTGLTETVADFVAKPGPQHQGQVFYKPLLKDGKRVSYEIYGVDHRGQWVTGEKNKPLILSSKSPGLLTKSFEKMFESPDAQRAGI